MLLDLLGSKSHPHEESDTCDFRNANQGRVGSAEN